MTNEKEKRKIQRKRKKGHAKGCKTRTQIAAIFESCLDVRKILPIVTHRPSCLKKYSS